MYIQSCADSIFWYTVETKEFERMRVSTTAASRDANNESSEIIDILLPVTF